MTTIKEFLARNRIRQTEERISKLQAIGAPSVTIEYAKKSLENPTKDIGKINEFGDLEFSDFNQSTGKGGKIVLRFYVEDRVIIYTKSRFGYYLFEGDK